MQIYLVGGAVRDQLLDYPVIEKDWLVVGATVQQMLDLGYQQVGKDFPVFLHPQSKDEYALARTERKSGQGYTGFECHTSPDVSIEEDLLRRDLTINAMVMDDSGNIIDPYNGQHDLTHRLLRHVSDAFVEDPLRILRVARFASRYYHLGFRIAPETLNLMQDMVDRGELKHLVKERIWKETQRSLMQRDADQFFIVLARLNCLDSIFPDLSISEPSSFHLPYLHKACEQLNPGQFNSVQLSLEQRFSLLVLDIFNTSHTAALTDRIASIQRIETQLKAPKNVIQFSKRFFHFLDLYQSIQTQTAEQILAHIKAMNLLKEPQLLEQLNVCFECTDIASSDAFVAQLESVIHAIRSINNQSFIQQGLTGKEIGQAIEACQLQLISSTFAL